MVSGLEGGGSKREIVETGSVSFRHCFNQNVASGDAGSLVEFLWAEAAACL